MDDHARDQLRGVVSLLSEAVDATSGAIGDAHLALARQHYAILGSIAPIAAPVRLVERIHLGIAGGVYASIRATARLSGGVLTRLLDR